MAIDTPAKLAILGAGPIGLEAALYARFLGYDVVILEQGRVCEHLQRRRHLRLLSPFCENSSPLGLAALTAQDESYQPPEESALLTGRQWIERYLQPLADSDLLSDHIHTNTRVLGVGKEQVRKTDLQADLPEGDERGDWSFRILVRDADGNERIEMVDGVLDCTGVDSHPNFAGHGGLSAIGELALRDKIVYQLPDILEADRGLFENQHTLLIGQGLDAAKAALLLDELQQQSPATKFTWITSHEQEPNPGPIQIRKRTRSTASQQLSEDANRIARETQAWKWGTQLERIRSENERFLVTLSGQLTGEHTFDRILALVGYRGDPSIFSELQIAVDSVTGGNDTPDVRRGEANYYVLGSKSAGRDAEHFSFQDGLSQIRQVFAILGDRDSLDLYSQRPELM